MKNEITYKGKVGHRILLNSDFLRISDDMLIRSGEVNWESKLKANSYLKFHHNNTVILTERLDNDIDEILIAIDLNNGERIKCPIDKDLVHLYESNDGNYFRRLTDEDLELVKYDIHFKISWSIKGKYQILFANSNLVVCYIRKENLIEIRNNLTGEVDQTIVLNDKPKWVDFGEQKFEKPSRVLGECDGDLYIYMYSGKILIFSANNERFITNTENDDQGSFFGHFMNSIELDNKNKKLIQLFNSRYTEVDLQTNNVKQEILKQFKESNVMNMKKTAFDESNIYFIQEDPNLRALHQFDRESKSIISTISLPSSSRINYIESQNDKIYCYDFGNKIYRVFEKNNYR